LALMAHLLFDVSPEPIGLDHFSTRESVRSLRCSSVIPVTR
jgi:hypothetical protein